MLSEFIETIIFGILGTGILLVFGTFIFLLIEKFKWFLFALLVLTFVYIVGWLIIHEQDFFDLFTTREEKPKEPLPSYGSSILDRLNRLEKKYSISTLKFMSFIKSGIIPFGMDNLDYLEWLSLVNELPLINTEKGED